MNTFLLLMISCFLLLQLMFLVSFSNSVAAHVSADSRCFNDSCGVEFNPYTALVRCSYLPQEFMKCYPPFDVKGNKTALDLLGHGCLKWGGQRHEDVMTTRVWCDALPHIECHGDRRFLSQHQVACVKYNGHYFVTTLIYSVLLGFLGMDRFCLGHTGTAVGKLLTLGGVGIWWVVDVILLSIGALTPADDSSWEPHY